MFHFVIILFLFFLISKGGRLENYRACLIIVFKLKKHDWDFFFLLKIFLKNRLLFRKDLRFFLGVFCTVFLEAIEKEKTLGTFTLYTSAQY